MEQKNSVSSSQSWNNLSNILHGHSKKSGDNSFFSKAQQEKSSLKHSESASLHQIAINTNLVSADNEFHAMSK